MGEDLVRDTYNLWNVNNRSWLLTWLKVRSSSRFSSILVEEDLIHLSLLLFPLRGFLPTWFPLPFSNPTDFTVYGRHPFSKSMDVTCNNLENRGGENVTDVASDWRLKVVIRGNGVPTSIETDMFSVLSLRPDGERTFNWGKLSFKLFINTLDHVFMGPREWGIQSIKTLYIRSL